MESGRNFRAVSLLMSPLRWRSRSQIHGRSLAPEMMVLLPLQRSRGFSLGIVFRGGAALAYNVVDASSWFSDRIWVYEYGCQCSQAALWGCYSIILRHGYRTRHPTSDERLCPRRRPPRRKKCVRLLERKVRQPRPSVAFSAKSSDCVSHRCILAFSGVDCATEDWERRRWLNNSGSKTDPIWQRPKWFPTVGVLRHEEIDRSERPLVHRARLITWHDRRGIRRTRYLAADSQKGPNFVSDVARAPLLLGIVFVHRFVRFDG